MLIRAETCAICRAYRPAHQPQASRAKRGEACRLDALVSQRSPLCTALARRTRLLNSMASGNAQHAYLQQARLVISLTIGAAVHVPVVCLSACTMSRCKPRASVS